MLCVTFLPRINVMSRVRFRPIVIVRSRVMTSIRTRVRHIRVLLHFLYVCQTSKTL